MSDDHPDSKLFPHATGAAATMVKEHEEEASLKLYSGWVNPYHKPKSLLKLNPQGLVPTLEFDQKLLYESTVICEFLEEAYPSSEPHLMPSDPYTRAFTRIWTDFVTSRIIPAFHRFLQHQPSSESSIEEVSADFLDKLQHFTEAMDPIGPYFLGIQVSMIDLILAPWALRLWAFDYFKGGLNMPRDVVWDRRRKWLSVIEKRQSIINTTSERD